MFCVSVADFQRFRDGLIKSLMNMFIFQHWGWGLTLAKVLLLLVALIKSIFCYSEQPQHLTSSVEMIMMTMMRGRERERGGLKYDCQLGKENDTVAGVTDYSVLHC